MCLDGGADAPGGFTMGGLAPADGAPDGAPACFKSGTLVVCFEGGVFSAFFGGSADSGFVCGGLVVCFDGAGPACFNKGMLAVCFDGGDDGEGGLFSWSLMRIGIFEICAEDN